MAYLDIVFHNIRKGGREIIGSPDSRKYYTSEFSKKVNVCQTPIAPLGSYARGDKAVPKLFNPSPYASSKWGENIAGNGNACGIFFCESSPYPYYLRSNYNEVWYTASGSFTCSAVPGQGTIPDGPPAAINNSFQPVNSTDAELYVCAFVEGMPDLTPTASVPFVLASPDWVLKSNPNCAIQCIGTGAPAIYNNAAAPGSDRYAIYFQATNRSYYELVDPVRRLPLPITGIFVHIKNTHASMGTQITALCRQFPDAIIFGDLNYNLNKREEENTCIKNPLTAESLNATISGTHTILAIEQNKNKYFGTRGRKVTDEDEDLSHSCIDYALIPNACTQNVELWAYDTPDTGLETNNSDHSVMMLRIRCNDY